MERCVHKYLYNYIIENAILLHFNQDLLGVTLLLTNYYKSIIHFVMLLTEVKRFEQFFATLVRLSTGYGIEDVSPNYQA